MNSPIYAKHLLDPEHSVIIAEGWVADCSISLYEDELFTPSPVACPVSPKYRADIKITSYDIDKIAIQKMQLATVPYAGGKLRKVMIVFLERNI
jgi:hypothetical protein